MKKALILFILLQCIQNWTQADGPDSAPKPAPPAASTNAQAPASNAPTYVDPRSRTSSINFEDEIVEGMNKNPFDSATNIYKRDTREQSRLYHKKENFNYELKLTIREMGLIQ